ncbi:unnamed protein product [Amoebophrya sp. A25]|nr:unnamed protein product [Amoebophrya sp. A25]|eukprot:GSA25T00007854001.1
MIDYVIGRGEPVGSADMEARIGASRILTQCGTRGDKPQSLMNMPLNMMLGGASRQEDRASNHDEGAAASTTSPSSSASSATGEDTSPSSTPYLTSLSKRLSMGYSSEDLRSAGTSLYNMLPDMNSGSAYLFGEDPRAVAGLEEDEAYDLSHKLRTGEVNVNNVLMAASTDHFYLGAPPDEAMKNGNGKDSQGGNGNTLTTGEQQDDVVEYVSYPKRGPTFVSSSGAGSSGPRGQSDAARRTMVPCSSGRSTRPGGALSRRGEEEQGRPSPSVVIPAVVTQLVNEWHAQGDPDVQQKADFLMLLVTNPEEGIKKLRNCLIHERQASRNKLKQDAIAARRASVRSGATSSGGEYASDGGYDTCDDGCGSLSGGDYPDMWTPPITAMGQSRSPGGHIDVGRNANSGNHHHPQDANKALNLRAAAALSSTARHSHQQPSTVLGRQLQALSLDSFVKIFFPQSEFSHFLRSAFLRDVNFLDIDQRKQPQVNMDAIKLFISRYFDDIHLEVKIPLMAEFMESFVLNVRERPEVLLKNCRSVVNFEFLHVFQVAGPVLQKLFQQYGGNSENRDLLRTEYQLAPSDYPELRTQAPLAKLCVPSSDVTQLFAQFKSALKPMGGHEVRNILRNAGVLYTSVDEPLWRFAFEQQQAHATAEQLRAQQGYLGGIGSALLSGLGALSSVYSSSSPQQLGDEQLKMMQESNFYANMNSANKDQAKQEADEDERKSFALIDLSDYKSPTGRKLGLYAISETPRYNASIAVGEPATAVQKEYYPMENKDYTDEVPVAEVESDTEEGNKEFAQVFVKMRRCDVVYKLESERLLLKKVTDNLPGARSYMTDSYVNKSLAETNFEQEEMFLELGYEKYVRHPPGNLNKRGNIFVPRVVARPAARTSAQDHVGHEQSATFKPAARVGPSGIDRTGGFSKGQPGAAPTCAPGRFDEIDYEAQYDQAFVANHHASQSTYSKNNKADDQQKQGGATKQEEESTFCVAARVDELERRDPGMLVLEMAPGRPFDRCLAEQQYCPVKDYPLIDWYAAVSSYLESFELWLAVALEAKKGADRQHTFFHGDPHLGNLFWCDTTKTFSIIDFGNSYEVFSHDYPTGLGVCLYEFLHGCMLYQPERLFSVYPFKPDVSQEQKDDLVERIKAATDKAYTEYFEQTEIEEKKIFGTRAPEEDRPPTTADDIKAACDMYFEGNLSETIFCRVWFEITTARHLLDPHPAFEGFLKCVGVHWIAGYKMLIGGLKHSLPRGVQKDGAYVPWDVAFRSPFSMVEKAGMQSVSKAKGAQDTWDLYMKEKDPSRRNLLWKYHIVPHMTSYAPKTLETLRMMHRGYTGVRSIFKGSNKS